MTKNNIQTAITPSSKGFECKPHQNASGQGKAIGSYCSHQGEFSGLFAVIPDGKAGSDTATTAETYPCLLSEPPKGTLSFIFYTDSG